MLSFATTGYYLAGGTLMMFTGTAIDRLGPRSVVLVCTFALCASLALLPFISAPWQIVPAYLLMAIGWAGTSWTAIPCILARWFDRKRGLAISIAFTGASFGGIIVTPLLIYLTNVYGFAPAAGAVALGGLAIIGALAVLFLHRGPEIFGLPLDGTTPRGETGAKYRATGAQDDTKPLRTVSFWTTTIAFSLALTTQVGFLTHQIPLLAPELGTQIAGLAVAVTTAASVCGRLALGLVIDRVEPRAVSAVAFAFQALALIGLSHVSAHWAIFAACIAYGVWVGGLITLPAVIVQREFRPGVFAATIGLVTSISQFAFAFGPGLLGFLRHVAGSYGPVLFTCAVLNLAAGALILVPRYASRA
jgi:MFS family permease